MTPPEWLPPLPPNTYYGGQLKDHEGDLTGHVIEVGISENWSRRIDGLRGMKSYPNVASADWHIALPLPEEDAKTEGDTPQRWNCCGEWMEPADEGIYMLFSDHETSLSAARAEVERWTQIANDRSQEATEWTRKFIDQRDRAVTLRKENKMLREWRPTIAKRLKEAESACGDYMAGFRDGLALCLQESRTAAPESKGGEGV